MQPLKGNFNWRNDRSDACHSEELSPEDITGITGLYLREIICFVQDDMQKVLVLNPI